MQLIRTSIIVWGIGASLGGAVVTGEPERAFHPQRVLVRFKPGVTGDGIAAAHRAAEVKSTLRTYRCVDDLVLVRVPAGTVEQAVARYRGHPNVLYAEPDYTVHTSVTPDDIDFPVQWALQNVGQTTPIGPGLPGSDINAVPAWDLTTGSSQIVVAVIDTGVDYTHPDLIDNMNVHPLEVPGNFLDDDGNGWIDDVYGYDFHNFDPDPMDDDSHGTHVAGIVAARGNNGIGIAGVSWHAKIIALKFLDERGSGDVSNAVAALDYAVANGIKISNNSWGGTQFSQAMYDAIAASQSIGHLFIAAAGNESVNTDLVPNYPSGYELPNVISVAATDNADFPASFTNLGPTTVDLAAPGVAIYSTIPGGLYDYKGGTSMATPHVAGAVALIMSRTPGLDAGQIRDRILGSTRPADFLNGWVVTGGVLSLTGALGDCNGNGVNDQTDILDETSEDCGANGIPDECEGDCNGNGVADSCDIFTGTSEDCDLDGIPDECEPDCDDNGVIDGCELADGLAFDCNGNDVIDRCESNFDGDAFIDGCDDDIDNDGVGNDIDECDFTPPGTPVYPSTGRPVGDINQNCMLDLPDFTFFWDCVHDGGPDRYAERRLCRTNFDYDGSETIDLRDVASFHNAFSGL